MTGLPRHLELAVRAMDEGADLSYSLIEIVNAGGGLPTFSPQELEYVSGMWIPPTGVAHRRQAAIDVGGWRHFRDVPDRDPEADLWMRLYQAGQRARFTRRLTAVKFSAGQRKGVYARRPTHEQAEWTKRIQTEADFEAVELAKVLIRSPGHGVAYRKLIELVGSETLRRARLRMRRLLGRGKPGVSQDEVYRERLKFKGIDAGRGERPGD